MKIFLDSADVNAIKKWSQIGLIDGVTTNPSLLAKVGGDPKERVLEICKALPHGVVSIEVTEKEPKAVYAQAKRIAELADNVVVKIPCHADYYQIIAQLVAEGIALNITLVFTLLQSAFMAKLGVAYISPFVGRWDDLDVDGAKLLYEIRAMLDQYQFETQMLAASVRSVRDFHDAVMAGSDAITVSLGLFEKAITHALTDQGMAKFDADWQTLGIKQFP